MSIKDRLTEDMKQAMKDREDGKIRLSVIRMIRSSIKNVEIDEKKELSEEETLGIIAKELKMRRDSLAEFEKAKRDDLAEYAKQEIKILMQYLPQQLSSEELKAIIAEAISKVGAVSAKEMGKVMAAVMPQVKGRADGKIINTIVREMLAE